MTNDELRIKVAELCRLKNVGWLSGGLVYGPDHRREVVPSYPNDLNACREFEASLRGKQVEWYQHNLERIVSKDTTDDDWSEEKGISANVRAWHASAEQRCRAFVATMTE